MGSPFPGYSLGNQTSTITPQVPPAPITPSQFTSTLSSPSVAPNTQPGGPVAPPAMPRMSMPMGRPTPSLFGYTNPQALGYSPQFAQTLGSMMGYRGYPPLNPMTGFGPNGYGGNPYAGMMSSASPMAMGQGSNQFSFLPTGYPAGLLASQMNQASSVPQQTPPPAPPPPPPSSSAQDAAQAAVDFANNYPGATGSSKRGGPVRHYDTGGITMGPGGWPLGAASTPSSPTPAPAPTPTPTPAPSPTPYPRTITYDYSTGTSGPYTPTVAPTTGSTQNPLPTPSPSTPSSPSPQMMPPPFPIFNGMQRGSYGSPFGFGYGYPNFYGGGVYGYGAQNPYYQISPSVQSPFAPINSSYLSQLQAAQPSLFAPNSSVSPSFPSGVTLTPENPTFANNSNTGTLGGRAEGGAVRHYDSGGYAGFDPTGTPTSSATADPVVSNQYGRYLGLDQEQLAQLAVRFGSSPQGQMIQRALMQKRMMPNAQQQPAQQQQQTGTAGLQPSSFTPQTQARGGHINPGLEGFIRKHYDSGGTVTGYLNGNTPGRTDVLHISPPAGAYVVPADVMAGLGDGNSIAGAHVLNKAFGMGPWGTKLPEAHQGRGMGIPAPPPRFSGEILAPSALPGDLIARGGKTKTEEGVGEPTPIIAAAGEFVIPPDVVKAIGGDDLKRGHEVLDQWTLKKRKETIEKMKKLKPPKKR